MIIYSSIFVVNELLKSFFRFCTIFLECDRRSDILGFDFQFYCIMVNDISVNDINYLELLSVYNINSLELIYFWIYLLIKVVIQIFVIYLSLMY